MALAYEGDNARSKRSYIATSAFNGNIFQYTTRLNMTTVKNEGQLTAITLTPAGAAMTAANCPAGRILREIGAKLYPGVHPGLAVGDTFNGAVVGTTATNHYWVKVFDAITGVRGYIDPNNAIFTVYNSDKSVEIVDAGEVAGGAATRLGQPVYTAGNITTTGGALIQQKPVTALGTGAATLTAAQLVGGVATQAAAGTQNLTVPLAADIITAMGSYVGTTCEFVYINTAAQAVTVVATSGDTGNTTFVGSVAVNATSARFIVRIASATTVVLYRA
jgi:hypothetical protein